MSKLNYTYQSIEDCYKILNKNGIIIIHRHKSETEELTKKINIFEIRNYGLSKIFFGN